MKRSAAALLAAVVVWAAACGGGLKTVGKDGYRATLSFSKDERFEIAVRGESRRVEAAVEGAPLVKIMRPDIKKTWQLRPTTKRVLETAWEPTDEIVPGYPLEPGFDPEAYADRFGGKIHRIGDDSHGLHPCDRWRMTLPSGDLVTLWVARDLEKARRQDRAREERPLRRVPALYDHGAPRRARRRRSRPLREAEGVHFRPVVPGTAQVENGRREFAGGRLS